MFHTHDAADVLEELGVDPSAGLESDEARRRLDEVGPNELVERGGTTPWRIFVGQFTDVMVIVLMVAAAVAAAIGDVKDAIVILVIVVLNAALGFVQEYRAERAIQALKMLAVPTVRVRRDGGTITDIPAGAIVPGDIVLLEAGSSIPADGRVVEATSLQVAEAALTGESYAVEKSTSALDGDDLSLGDRRNMVFMGTAVTHGKGAAVVVGTGMSTELGHIADMLQTIDRTTTPLQKRMAQLGKGLAVAAVGIVAVVFVLGLIRGEEVREMFLTSIALAVAAVPEGLPAVVTIALSLGAQRMLRRQVLIRKLPAVETLGSVTVICSDKTGTITQNRMIAAELAANGTVTTLSDLQLDASGDLDAVRLALLGSLLCNDTVLDATGGDGHIGDPTEIALAVAALTSGIDAAAVVQEWPRVAEAPFTSERKRMTTVHEVPARHQPTLGAGWVAMIKGAPDGLIDLASATWVDAGPVPMTDELRSGAQAANSDLASEGRRVLGVALRPLEALPTDDEIEDLERDLTFLGMITMVDPPREEVPAAVKACRRAGIRPVMITGDHPLTARRIAADVGIDTVGRAVTGAELNEIDDDELAALVAEVSVYARVSPEHKLRIVGALQDQGEVVAMTGDGVNDAPALRKADIGVAMGITGTDVSKEAGGMVLLDDNFATIVKAVREGRTIYDNIRKFIKYTMTSNSGEIYTMLLAPFLGLPLPLTAIQILWVNLVTDGLPGLALSFEPSEPNVMEREPYAPDENIFGRGMGKHILWVGLLMGVVSLLAGLFYYNADNVAWQTMIFTVLTLSQMGQAMSVRSDRESLFKLGLRSNLPLLGAVLLTLALQLLVIYWGPLQRVFGTEALSLLELGIAMVAATIVFWVVEIEKFFRRRRAT
ncbi:MAG: cation-translocating P-type ATPase [bacterium]|nr:cation-translocating P-type ATPase [bacterium]MCP4963748.1 cation-translocating P-type ATPase [bacterium]